MTKYRKKNVVINAVQKGRFNINANAVNIVKENDWLVKAYEEGTIFKKDGKEYVKTLEGDMLIGPMDYIIQGVQGEIYPCKPDIFEATYDRFKDITDIERVVQIHDISTSFDDPEKTNLISDGSHTFGDLYYQRMMLTSVIAKALVCMDNKWGYVRRSKLHDDGTMFKDYFIVYFTTADGDFSYHYHMDNWDNFWFVEETERAPKWDGHTDVDVNRLLSLFPLIGEPEGD